MRKAWRPDWAAWVSPTTVETLRETYMPDMPPVEAGAYLIDYLLEIGPTESAGMGVAPISFREIDAWCNRKGIDLAPWEASFLRRLSRVYLIESQRAEKLGAHPPWEIEDMKPEASSTKASIRALAKL